MIEDRLLVNFPGSTLKLATLHSVANATCRPFYIYDSGIINRQIESTLSMPNAFGLSVRYAMKALSNAAIIQHIASRGLEIDASSMNEMRRAYSSGVSLDKIMLTTQEVPLGDERGILERAMEKGLKYNVCSMLQLELIAGFAASKQIPLSMRIHPEEGSGESDSRNTGGPYSCFGVHLSDVPRALAYAKQQKLIFDKVHVHIGSGGSPEKWRTNIDKQLAIVEQYFLDATTVSFGGGLKVARMPDETGADVKSLGEYAKQRIEEFQTRTSRKLKMEIEPGTYIVANSGFAVTEVIDKKHTGPNGNQFIISTGGMEVVTRPLMYSSRHPFYVMSRGGQLLSSEFELANAVNPKQIIHAGWCCESGDGLNLTNGKLEPRLMAEPGLGDLFIVGGAGAYCSSMSPFNYNSHTQAPEFLAFGDDVKMIRVPQKLQHVFQNERGLNTKRIKLKHI